MNSKKPNILIIHADQHRWDCLGANGNRQIRTPNLDSLAKAGVTYPNSFCPFPVCTPSRYSLFTGLYVHQHMGYSNHCTIPPELDTFPKILRQNGYRTKAVGKMHTTPTYLDMGFEEMILAEQDGTGRHEDDYHRWLRSQDLFDGVDLMDQEQVYRKNAPAEYWNSFGAGRSDLDEEHYSTTWIGEKAVSAISDWGEECNLLFVGFIKPHHPFDPPAPWDTLYRPDELSPLPGYTESIPELDQRYCSKYFPYEGLDIPSLQKVMAQYYGTISHIDSQVGKMLDLLKEKGLYENTMIVYTGDHGEYMGYRHMLLKGGHLYDPLAKVPLIIKFPGVSGGGEVRDTLTSTVDVASTVLAVAGCEPNRFMTGLNLSDNNADRTFAFCEDRRQYMARSKTRKLLWGKDETVCQFFDLERDPLEMNNLYSHPDYRQEIDSYKRAVGNWMLFEATTPVYLDELAPVIDQENVQPREDGHIGESYVYFREKMKEFDYGKGE